MLTIIFDIDGTITDMWPIEKSVLLYMTKSTPSKIQRLKDQDNDNLYDIFKKISKNRFSKATFYPNYNKAFLALEKSSKLPSPIKYPIINWIFKKKDKYNFVYATGGQKPETLYILKSLKLEEIFDIQNSIDRTNCIYSKKTGFPFKRICSKYQNCLLITDSEDDCLSAKKTAISYIKILPGEKALTIEAKLDNIL